MDFFSLGMGVMTLLNSSASENTKGLSTLAEQIFEYASYILIPIMIVVGVAGIFYGVYLGVNLAKADSADKRQEAKARMVNAIIGFVAIFVIVLLMYLFCHYANQIFGWTHSQTIGSSGGWYHREWILN